ncbi:FKBP12-interacting protein of 37 kDa-like [Rana temporaria]|uniref:FKBP12-interacting protein of 37 kDa-like n=1 Tax=Rana temporaria TaxID=8407 RepID=UPI001AAE0F98|nr:FKBP12-interacting protein of 37 kDa-like [Rana temporaria]
MSSYEVSRYVLKCQKERDDALRREESARDKLKHLEVSTRSQVQELKNKVKDLTSENKSLHRTVKKLRTEVGLEGNPKFKGKVTKDIIKELHEMQDQCSQLKEDNHLLSVQLREMVPAIAQNHKQKAELQTQLQDAKNQMEDLSNENAHLSQLLQESCKEKEDIERTYLMFKKSIEDAKKVVHRSVQTTTSIPVTLQPTYKKVSRESSSSQASQVFMEKKNTSSEASISPPVSNGSTPKPYYKTVRNQSS